MQANQNKNTIVSMPPKSKAANTPKRQKTAREASSLPKPLERMTKAELIGCIQSMRQGAPNVTIAFEHQRVRHELDVHHTELEAQNLELRESQCMLEASRDLYADLYDFAPVGYLTLNAKGVILGLNLATASMLGVERTRLVGTSFQARLEAEAWAAFREHLGQLGTTNRIVLTELRIVRKDRPPLFVLMQSICAKVGADQTAVFRTSLTDITARKEAEEAARAGAALNQAILSSLSAHIAIIDGQGAIIAVNEAWKRFAERNAAPPSHGVGEGSNYLEVCRNSSGNEAGLALAGLESVLHGTSSNFRMDYACPSPHEKRWFEMTVTPLSGGQRGAVISHSDITPRRLAQQALAEQEARLRAVLDTAVEAIITIDERGLIESLNRAAESLFGYSATEVLGQNVSLLMPSPDRERHDGYLANHRRTGERKIIGIGREVEGRRKDGSIFPMELAVSTVALEQRRIFTGFVRDITERRRAEKALREREAQLLSFVQHVPAPIAMLDRSMNYLAASARWIQDFGQGRPNLSGLNHYTLLPDLPERWREIHQLALGGQPQSCEEDLWVRADGTRTWLRWMVRPWLDVQGGIGGILIMSEDITERKIDEQRRRLQYEISTLLAGPDGLEVVIPRVLRSVAEAMDWDVGEFWEVVPAPEKLHMIHVWHRPDQKLADFVKRSLRLSVSMFDGIPGQVLRTGEPHWISEVARCPHFERKRAAARARLRSAVAFPVRLDHQPLGVMAFLAHDTLKPDEELLKMFDSLGSQIGQFIERKRTEERLVRSEKAEHARASELAALLEAIPTPVFIAHDQHCRHITGNQAAERLLNLPRGAEVSLSAPPEKRPRNFKAIKDGRVLKASEWPLQQAARGLLVGDFEFVLAFEDGSNCEMIGYGTPLLGEDGVAHGAVGVAVDITALKRAEQEQARFFALAENSREFIAMCDLDFRPIYVNPAGLRLVGLPDLEGARRTKVREFFFPEDQAARMREFYPKVLREGHAESEIRFRHFQTGAPIWMFHNVFCLRDSRGRTTGYATVSSDITERKRMEREILEISEREQRRFSADLHDGLGQKLTGLEMLSHALAEELTLRAPETAAHARRLNTLLRETVTETRLISHHLAPISVEGNGLTRGLEDLAAHVNALPRVQCGFVGGQDVRIDELSVATHLYRIAQEAVNNTLKHGRARRIIIELKRTPEGIELSVTNNGRPFPKVRRKKQGMGLNVMRYRAELIGGRLSITPRPRGGARVACLIPPKS